ncbi:MAG: peptidylprolyl isomerase, partial [Planctomycetota bacterium]
MFKEGWIVLKYLTLLALVATASIFAACYSLTEAQEKPPVPEEKPAAEKPAEDSSEKPKEEPAKELKVPTGEKTDAGLKFDVDFKRGKGSLHFSKQGDYLRVDADVRLVYYAGSPSRGDWGSSMTLALSANGLHGRQFIYYPNPAWQPPANGALAPYRLEASYGKDEGVKVLKEKPVFGARSNVKFYDRWQATMFFDLRYIVTPGNTPSAVSDDWFASVTLGNQAGMIAFPTGVNGQNPALTIDKQLKFKISELPELEEEDDDPIESAIEFETISHASMKKVLALLNIQSFKGSYDEVIKFAKDYPDSVWAPHMAYKLVDAAIRNLGNPALAGIPTDQTDSLLALIATCPGQVQPHDSLLSTYFDAGKYAEAKGHFDELLKSSLCTGSESVTAHLQLEYAKSAAGWGEVAEAQAMIDILAASKFVKADVNSRVELKRLEATLAERNGDSTAAKKIYGELLEAERDNLSPQAIAEFTRTRLMHDTAIKQWEKELEFRKADAKKTNPKWTIVTSKGTIEIELFEDDAPNTVSSLVKLTKGKFYDGLSFHRVIASFMAQGGCPNGNGSGSPGYSTKFEDNKRCHFRGTVAMARSQSRDSQGSQFYICVANSPNVLNLTGNYVTVGRVTNGMEIVDSLRIGDKIISATISNLRDHEYVPTV